MHARKHWIIQNSGLRAWGPDEKLLIDALNAAGVPFYGVGVISFTNEVTIPEDLPDVPGFLHCSTKLLGILSRDVPATEMFPQLESSKAEHMKGVLLASVSYDHNRFDQRYYRKSYLLEKEKVLLNHDSHIIPIKKVMHEELPYDVFIKPTSDLKLFKGGVFEAGRTLYQQVCSSGMVDSNFIDAKEDFVALAPLKEITREWRFLVVGKHVVTGSQYMKDGNIVYDEYIPPRVFEQAMTWATYYQPADMFTMDLCQLSNGELYIVEYNCINASGLYHCDIEKFARLLAT